MKFLLLISVISFLIAASRAAESIGFYKDSKHPGKCVVDGVILSPGDEAQVPNGCGRMICGGKSLVTFHSCGVQGAPPGYKLGERIKPNADYPDCCERENVLIT